MNKEDLYRRIIVDNSSKPTNKVKARPEGYLQNSFILSSCEDDFEVFMKLGDKIEDIKFAGLGCSISTTSLELLSTYLVGMTRGQGTAFIDNYRNMVTGKDFVREPLKDLIALENVSQYLNRVNCALTGANTLSDILGGKYE